MECWVFPLSLIFLSLAFFSDDVCDFFDVSRWSSFSLVLVFGSRAFFPDVCDSLEVDVVLFLAVPDLSRSGDFLVGIELGFFGFELFEMEVRFLRLALERVVFIVVELVVALLVLLDLLWLLFSMAAFVVELLLILMDLAGLICFWLSVKVFFFASPSCPVASVLLP